MTDPDRSLELLRHSARVSPILRDAVDVVASEVATLRAENERLRMEHGVMAEVLDALDRATRLPLGKSPFDVGFVWAQNQEALLAGTTTWADQFGAASVSSEGSGDR